MLNSSLLPLNVLLLLYVIAAEHTISFNLCDSTMLGYLAEFSHAILMSFD